MTKTGPRLVAVYLQDQLANWEPSFVLPELRQFKGWQVASIAESVAPIITLGGLKILPDMDLSYLDSVIPDLLVIPGGNSWKDAGQNTAITHRLTKLRDSGVQIAAICAATLALARVGILDDVAHTSNGVDWLSKLVPEYRGQARYLEKAAASDGGVITASGTSAIEWSYQIFRTLKVYDEAEAREWLQFYGGRSFS